MPQAAAARVGIAGPTADAIQIAVLSSSVPGCTSGASWVLAAASTLNRGCMSGASSAHVAASSSNRACTSGALLGRVGACERRLNPAATDAAAGFEDCWTLTAKTPLARGFCLISFREYRLPITTAPVPAPPAIMVAMMPAPVAVAPAVVASVPMPMPVPLAGPVAVPMTALLGRELPDLGFRGDRGARIKPGRQLFIWGKRVRQKRRGARAGCKRGRARGKSNRDLKKMTAFHDISL